MQRTARRIPESPAIISRSYNPKVVAWSDPEHRSTRSFNFAEAGGSPISGIASHPQMAEMERPKQHHTIRGYGEVACYFEFVSAFTAGAMFFGAGISYILEGRRDVNPPPPQMIARSVAGPVQARRRPAPGPPLIHQVCYTAEP